TRTNAVEKKKNYETVFQNKVLANPEFKSKYSDLLSQLDKAYANIESYSLARDYYSEIISRIELFTIASNLNTLVTAYDKDGQIGYDKRLPVVLNNLNKIYKEFNSQVDQKIFESLMQLYVNQPGNFTAEMVDTKLKSASGSYSSFASNLYNETSVKDSSKILNLLDGNSVEVITSIKEMDAVKLFVNIQSAYQTKVQEMVNNYQTEINMLQRTYMQAQMEVMKNRAFYPDANSTLRLTYGKVNGYEPRDGIKYEFLTDLDGVMEKYKPGDYEFDVPEKLRELYANKDYGHYGKNGKMPVCFIATNHTTGGNSGSPVFDAYGNLIGLNFDRVWEGTMSDINYDPSICRNIQVDIRYVLFIIDKFAGAEHLIKELKLVTPPKSKLKK
ncbi:MAG: S46 family peptidase, partial [Ferruginibacter sp.]